MTTSLDEESVKGGVPHGPVEAESAGVSSRMRFGPRICIFGHFGSTNLGNEGSLESMLGFLQESFPDSETACACRLPDELTARYGIEGISLYGVQYSSATARIANRLTLGVISRLSNLLHAYRTLRRFDIVIVPGTGILDDFGETWRGMPLTLFEWGIAARLARRPFCLVCIGAGPIRSPISLRLMRSAARLARYRSYRDKVSRNYMKTIGLDVESDPVVPDIAFRLPAPPADNLHPSSRVLTVGVGVMAYRGWFGHLPGGKEIYLAYLTKMTAFLQWLLKRGYSIRLVIGETTDEAAVNDISERIGLPIDSGPPQPGKLVSEPTRSLHDLMHQLSDTDVVVATRYHNVVCALRIGKPVISIGYAKKNDDLLDAVGLSDFCQSIEALDVDLLIDQFLRVIDQRDRFAEQIRATVANFREQLHKQEAERLSKLIELSSARNARQ